MGHNCGKKHPMMTPVNNDPLHMVTTIPWKFDQNLLKTEGEVGVTRISVVKLAETDKGLLLWQKAVEHDFSII